jgi:hypothetical protein
LINNRRANVNALDDSTKRGWPLKRLVVIQPDMFESPAFHDLSKTAMIVLMRFLQKRTWDEGKRGSRKKKLKNVKYQDEDLIFIGREANWLGIKDSSFRRAIKELVEHGFITVDHQGGAYGPKKDPSRYRLVETWRLWGTNSFPHPTKPKCLYTGSFDKHNQKKQSKKVSVKNDC